MARVGDAGVEEGDFLRTKTLRDWTFLFSFLGESSPRKKKGKTQIFRDSLYVTKDQYLQENYVRPSKHIHSSMVIRPLSFVPEGTLP